MSLAVLLEMFTCVSGVTLMLIKCREFSSSHSRITVTSSFSNSVACSLTLMSAWVENICNAYVIDWSEAKQAPAGD